MRIAFSVIFIALIVALIRCYRSAHRSNKAIGASVALLIGALIPDALFFFDASGQCIWANRPGMALTDIQSENYEPASDRLAAMFGDYAREETTQREVTLENHTRSFVTVSAGSAGTSSWCSWPTPAKSSGA